MAVICFVGLCLSQLTLDDTQDLPLSRSKDLLEHGVEHTGGQGLGGFMVACVVSVVSALEQFDDVLQFGGDDSYGRTAVIDDAPAMGEEDLLAFFPVRCGHDLLDNLGPGRPHEAQLLVGGQICHVRPQAG